MKLKDWERLNNIAQRLRSVTGLNFEVKVEIKSGGLIRINGWADAYNNSITITQGCLMLDDHELAALLSHEVSHLISPNKEIIEKLCSLSRIKRLVIKILSHDVTRLTKELLHVEELYCDARAKQIAKEAGYDPDGMLRLMYIVAEICKQHGYDYNHDFPTHPSKNIRISSLTSLIIQNSP